jgi:mannose-6-phosphate isomerase-like protein (cupin superfamily)
MSLQQVYAEAGKRRREVSRDDVIEWTTERNSTSGVFEPELGDGDALFFDGRLWHGSRNTGSETRTALLLQYATPDTPIRIPDFDRPEWPFRFRDDVRPPCVMVAGTTCGLENRIVPAPEPAAPEGPTRATDAPPLDSRIDPLNLPLRENTTTGWQPTPVFCGSTSSLDYLECHVSVLSRGASPHDMHAHIEEELLIVLAGEADLLMLDDDRQVSRHHVGRGACAYYPAFQPHTIDNAGSPRASYLMLKWAASRNASGVSELRRCLRSVNCGDFTSGPFSWTRLFEGPTRHLEKLHCHATALDPGGGYDAHADPYDVVIVTFEGEVLTAGRTVGPNSVIYSAAGQPHDMRNVGRRRARYLVFELHGSGRKRAGPAVR